VLAFTAAAVAQPRSGNIYGRILDRSEAPLAGASVTLTGSYTAPQVLVTTAEGNFRFLSLPPAIGGTTYLALIMEAGALEEHITVVAATPILDTKRTVIGIHVTQDILQFLPTSRDPWVILQMAPAIIMDRENVGGAESGQQSNYVARGASDYGNNIWSVDGIVITDPAAIGTSPSYYDFDAFEEMQIMVGGADVTVQTGGVALNMVTRRGGNKASFGGRFYAVDEKFQATHGDRVAEFKKTERSFEGINRIRNNKDYGFNIGLPLRKDRVWFWGSYGVQDIKTSTIYGTRDDTLLENYAVKLNLQPIPQNRMEVFVHVGGKKKSGRSASAENPDGLFQQSRYHFGSPIIKFQDEHMFGDDLFMSLKYAFSDAGFSLAPMTDLDFNKLPVWDQTAQRYFGSQAARYRVQRPLNHYSFLINYFKDAFLGAGHDIKLGFEYSDRNQYVEDVWSGNCTLTRNFNSPVVDFSGSGLPEVPPAGISPYFTYLKFWRGHFSDQHVDALSAYLSDTVTFGRFNLLVGLRWDKQTPWLNPFKVMAMDGGGAWDAIAPDDVQQKLDALLPGVRFEQVTAKYSDGGDYNWTVWSPRLGLTWDVTGDGRTLAKVSLATYGDFMSTELADRWRSGGASGWLGFCGGTPTRTPVWPSTSSTGPTRTTTASATSSTAPAISSATGARRRVSTGGILILGILCRRPTLTFPPRRAPAPPGLPRSCFPWNGSSRPTCRFPWSGRIEDTTIFPGPSNISRTRPAIPSSSRTGAGTFPRANRPGPCPASATPSRPRTMNGITSPSGPRSIRHGPRSSPVPIIVRITSVWTLSSTSDSPTGGC
jgi:hypothetical protein